MAEIDNLERLRVEAKEFEKIKNPIAMPPEEFYKRWMDVRSAYQYMEYHHKDDYEEFQASCIVTEIGKNNPALKPWANLMFSSDNTADKMFGLLTGKEHSDSELENIVTTCSNEINNMTEDSWDYDRAEDIRLQLLVVYSELEARKDGLNPELYRKLSYDAKIAINKIITTERKIEESLRKHV